MVDNQPRVLAGRYEVGELIGRGGMAEVHLGHDNRLGRAVAIKILRSDLARDPSFLARFRREAQSAASLNHPAVVSVYDTGEDVYTDPATGAQINIPFIVMEYVEGHTVREILTHGTAVPIDEAVEITMGVLSALEYSHHAGIVHRDIKPANVMITPTGAVKVMDFGIARAVADSASTMTQTQAVIGTAQYLSPEQARGETVDARSDLYSTGCLLFELLTGRPPFTGDSPVAVAYQHVGQQAPPPSQFASDVPPELDRIVAKALAKERDTRYSSAAEFRADLERYLVGEEPLAGTGAVAAGLVGAVAQSPSTRVNNTVAMSRPTATVAMPVGAGSAPTALAPTALASGPDLNQTVALATPGLPNQGNATQVLSAAALAGAGGAVTGAVPATQALPQPPGWTPVSQPPSIAHQPQPSPQYQPPPRRRSKAWLGVLIPLLLAGAGFLAWHFFGNGLGGTTNRVEVPTLQLGMTREDARPIIENAGLRFNDQLDEESDAPAGSLTRQDPEPGVEVEAGSPVNVYFSGGPQDFAMPDLTNRTLTEALAELESRGLVLGETTRENSPRVPENLVTRTEPAAGSTVQAGQSVDIMQSTGMLDLPNVVGQNQTQALATLETAGVTLVTVNEVQDDTAAADTVIAQNPGSGSMNHGTRVTLNVAVAPVGVLVPNVVGMTWNAQTENMFTQAGLVPIVQQAHSNSVPAGVVISTNPSGNTRVSPNSNVGVIVSSGPVATTPAPPPPQPPAPPPTEEPTYPGGGGGDYGAGQNEYVPVNYEEEASAEPATPSGYSTSSTPD